MSAVNDVRRRRLKIAREHAGYESARSAAIAFGWAESTYASHENGQNNIKADKAETYGRAFHVSPAWIMYGKEPPSWLDDKSVNQPKAEIPSRQFHLSEVASTKQASRPGELLEIDVRAGDEEGVPRGTSVRRTPRSPDDRWQVPPDFLEYTIGSAPTGTAIIEVQNDAMSPTFNSGDRALVDLTDTEIDDGLFAIVRKAKKVVRRLGLILDGTDRVSVECDNPLQTNRSQIVPTSELVIIGRVTGRIQKV